MKILFLVDRTERTRHFLSVVRELAERGHDILIAPLPGEGKRVLPRSLDDSRIRLVACPGRRVDGWRGLVGPLRIARDYVRYFDPRFASATRLRRRAEGRIRKEAGGFKRFCERYAWIRRRWRLAERAFALVEDVTPSDRRIEAFFRSHRPDVVLITPLIHFGSPQTDYVKSARALGLPVGFLPFSWDNLTGRGLIRVIPDRILVWNEIQKREAVDLHGVPPERVIVTGAPRFDEFFAMGPATTRQEYCAQLGLDPAQPYILYLCSDDFVTDRREVDFARRWVGEIRRSPDPTLRTCGVLIRPHPAWPDRWVGVDTSDLPGVAVSGARLVNADPGLYDAVYHSSAVVGLSTSAMIEAGILGKPVHTILVPEFEGQQGTLYFSYLLRENGGLVFEARDFDQHRAQLSLALAGKDDGDRQTSRFVESFVRPHGLDVPATPIMVREIELLADLRRRPRLVAPLWHYPARWALRPLLKRRLVPAMVRA